jgi:diadenosine tetraphosphatase ApaH/serine/threonine PP2A family protein phosphatase
VVLVGNHDLIALGAAGVDVADFNPEAAAASLWTREQLTPASRTFLEGLRPSAEVDGAQLFHGSPRDPVWEYILDELAALEALALTTASVVLVGHSHVSIALLLESGGLTGGHAPAGLVSRLDEGRWLLNPGSVGQPRDGNPNAAFLELDLGAGSTHFRRVAYPVARTQEEIRERGLPDSLAERLAHGV